MAVWLFFITQNLYTFKYITPCVFQRANKAHTKALKALVKYDIHQKSLDSVKETLELVQTDIAKVNREITALKITPKAQIPKKTAAQEKSSSKMDVASI